LREQGARLLAEYGAEQLFSVEEAQWQTLANQTDSQAVSLRDEENLLLLNAGTLDTSLPASQTLRQRSAAAQSEPGKALHLVQFVGPVKPEWYAALTGTGAEVISYIPHNAYLIYGDETVLAKVQSWAQRSAAVQWDGPFADSYKLDPSVTELRQQLSKTSAAFAPDQTPELFALQLVNDSAANAETLQLINSLRVEPVKSQFRILNYLNVIVRLPLSAVEKILTGRRDILSIAR